MDIPKSVKTIEENTFLGCNTLTAIKLYPDEPVFKRNYANIPNLKENIAKGLGMIRTETITWNSSVYQITATFASDYLKRNTASVKCAMENDVFGSLPDNSLLDDLEVDA